MKMRTAVYSAEEKALMVMLEGEQEEERRREQDKLVKHEKEKLIQRKQEVNAMLFGGKILLPVNICSCVCSLLLVIISHYFTDELPADTVLQPFSEYYTQAEHSLLALLQIRYIFIFTSVYRRAMMPQKNVIP